MVNSEPIPLKEMEPSRIISIDVFRGFLIPLMTFVNTTSYFDNTPLWLRHVNGIGLTITDLVAPFFIFAIGLTYKMVHYKNENLRTLDRVLRTLRRYLALFGMGMLSSLRFPGGVPTFNWDTLAYIGLAGCLTISVIEFSWKIRLIVVCLLSIGYQVVIELFIGDIIAMQIEGGLYGVASWTCMLILGTILAESISKKKFMNFLYFGLILLVTGIIMHFLFDKMGLIGVSRKWVSIPFVYVSIGLASCLYTLFWFIFDYKQLKFPVGILGRNPLFLFIMQGILTAFIVPLFPQTLHLAWIILIAVFNVLIVGVIGFILNIRKIYIRF